MSITISKISFFSSGFKPNEKKKVPLKNMVERGGLQENFYWRGFIFDRRGGGIISKKWSLG